MVEEKRGDGEETGGSDCVVVTEREESGAAAGRTWAFQVEPFWRRLA